MPSHRNSRRDDEQQREQRVVMAATHHVDDQHRIQADGGRGEGTTLGRHGSEHPHRHQHAESATSLNASIVAAGERDHARAIAALSNVNAGP